MNRCKMMKTIPIIKCDAKTYWLLIEWLCHLNRKRWVTSELESRKEEQSWGNLLFWYHSQDFSVCTATSGLKWRRERRRNNLSKFWRKCPPQSCQQSRTWSPLGNELAYWLHGLSQESLWSCLDSEVQESYLKIIKKQTNEVLLWTRPCKNISST